MKDTTLNEILIAGKSADNKSLWIILDSAEGAPGTYENHRGRYPAGGFYDGQDTNYWYAGELTIYLISNTNVAGTFKFNAKSPLRPDTVAITDGQFDVPVIYGNIRH